MKGTFDTPSILIIYTGGTIGMVEDRRTGALENYDFAHVRRWIPELDEFDYNIESYAFKPAIDSSDMEPANWAAIVKVIADKYEKYGGFARTRSNYVIFEARNKQKVGIFDYFCKDNRSLNHAATGLKELFLSCKLTDGNTGLDYNKTGVCI